MAHGHANPASVKNAIYDVVTRQFNGELSSEEAVTELKAAVEGALAGRGYRQVSDPSSANLLVQYHIGLQNRTETRVDTFGAPIGGPVACGVRGCIGGFGWGMYGPPMDVDVRNINYVEGTVMLDLIDKASGKLAWRATSQKRLDQSDADQAGVNAIFADMVKTLP